MTEDRRYLKGAFREVAHRIHEAWPDNPSSKALDGSTEVGPRNWVDNHPLAIRLTVVKFLPTGQDGTRMNHGIGVDIWVGTGVHLRGWSHGKGSVEMTFTRDPKQGEYLDALVYLARWAGLLFGGSQEIMDANRRRVSAPQRDLIKVAAERTTGPAPTAVEWDGPPGTVS
jgi:hypothetical protein